MAAELPFRVLGEIFSYLDLFDLLAGLCVCKHWYECLNEENNKVWRTHCERTLRKDTLVSGVLFSVRTFKAKLRAFYHAWNIVEIGLDVVYFEDEFTLIRYASYPVTAAFRGKRGFTTGRHCWEVWWDYKRPIVQPHSREFLVGVATRFANLHSQDPTLRVGGSHHSWGWDVLHNELEHDGEAVGTYPKMSNPPEHQSHEKIRVILDCERHTLAFEIDSFCFGTAFEDLPPITLFPAVSITDVGWCVSMVYLGDPLDG